MTHDELVAIGARWLFNTKRYPVVVTEFSNGGEIPDVLGWNGWGSSEIDAKVSVADIRADHRKTSRRIPESGVAARRYYLVPEAIHEQAATLLPTGWGLLYIRKNGRHIVVHKESDIFDVDRRADIHIFLSIVRRIAGTNRPLRGIQVRCYTDNSWIEREHLVRDFERAGMPVDEAEIARKLKPRARLLVKPIPNED